ncbi:MAG TPA: MlaE family lipid ABC transporter permease subunit [candidate division Zixibacteria bacterium]|nr:MlaE family lipid ABC transporter permease subunit [candidate division Zixibacteria bacterium]
MASHSSESATLSQGADGTVRCSGAWKAGNVPELERRVAALRPPAAGGQIWEMGGITAMDTAGAWLVRRSIRRLEQRGARVELRGLRPEFDELIRWVSRNGSPEDTAAGRRKAGLVESLGRLAWEIQAQAFGFLSFLGQSMLVLARLAVAPHRMRWQAFFYNLKAGGLEAIPIVGLLSFLMGIVIAYQAAVQLRPYGANVFIVEFVGIAMLREIAPVITAIIVAGRSGSAYTAQIGTMEVTEEVDALHTLGIGPLELLVVPKVLALALALPLLTAFADVTGVLGGMVVASTQLNVPFDVFLDRFKSVISLTNYLIGVGKAPVFAFIIAMIGCYQGFRVSGSAESVGRHTTISVVQAIFLVIVFDALFSILLSWMGIGLFA